MKEKYEQAYEDYKKGMKYKDIAKKYCVTVNTVKSWKTRHWGKKGVHTKNKKVCTQIGRGNNPNSHKNGTGPPKNQNAVKHGFFSKWLPEETLEILGEVESKSSLDLLWDNIQLQYAAIIRAQKLMYVTDQEDKTIEKVEEKSGNVMGERWEVQQAWDKQASFMSAQSRAMKTLESMVKNYEELLHKNWELATEEQKARIDNLKSKIDTHEEETESDDFLEALEGTAKEDWQDEETSGI